MKIVPYVLLGWLLASAGWAEPQIIKLRSGNGSIKFSIGHLLSSTEGSFDSFRGQIVYDREDAQKDAVEWVVNVRSVNTGNPSRD